MIKETFLASDVKELGLNYRMSEIHAAIGLEQMKKINDFLRIRKKF